MGTWDLEPLLGIDPSVTLPEVLRFTSLFGGSCGWPSNGLDSIGAAEPRDMASDGESGPTLDLGLLLREMGMVDRRLIHDPLDETESLLGSSPMLLRSDEKSPFRTIESLLARPLLKVSNLELEECGGASKGEGTAVEEPRIGRNCRLSGVVTVELVAGREEGRNTPLVSTRSPTFLFFDVGRRGVEVSGRPKASPMPATPTVLVATSCTGSSAYIFPGGLR